MSKQKAEKNHDSVVKNNNIKNPSIISSFFAFSEELASLKYLKWMMIALLPVLIVLRFPVDRVDYDIWWQMAHGKYYLAHHTLTMDISAFSWTPMDPTWIYNTCLGSIAVYLFYHFMGGFGLWLFQSLIFLGIFLAFYLFLRLINERLDINNVTIIAAIAMACSLACRFYKPELFSALFIAWTAFIFFYIKITRKKWLFYIYPFLFALWVNLHGAFLVGLTFLGLAFLGEILNRFFFSGESFTTKELAHFGAALVLSMAATLLNPYGIHYIESLFPVLMNAITHESYSGSSTYNKSILAYISLWSYLKKFNFLQFCIGGLTVWIMTLMVVAVVALSAYEAVKKRSCDFTLVIISCALYWKGMETSRASYFFPIVFFFIFFYLLNCRLKLNLALRKASVFSILIFVFFFVMISYFNIRYAPDNEYFGAGMDNFVPAKEVAFLKKYKLPGPIFNDYVVGGYLVWALYPDYKVFIDPRGGAYGKQVFPDYMDFTTKRASAEDINRFVKKYPFKIAILHYRQMTLIFDFLQAGDDWRLLYFEKNAAILIHKSLLPAVQSEMGNVNLNPLRFRSVRNPDILFNVFNFYVRLNPKAGRYIYDVFKKNVSDFYKLKPEILNYMEISIQNKEQELQNKNNWLSP